MTTPPENCFALAKSRGLYVFLIKGELRVFDQRSVKKVRRCNDLGSLYGSVEGCPRPVLARLRREVADLDALSLKGLA